MPKTIGAVIFPGFELLDLFGPLEMFGMLEDAPDIRVVAETMDPVVSRQGPASALVTTVCTGSALLARTGRLDGIAATSNKAAFKWVMAQGPKVDWKAEARWVEDGKFMTSSGVSAGMDMALAAVQRLYGEAEAERVATRTEYDWKRDASWDPFAKIHGLV